jgi:hypothetical protein
MFRQMIILSAVLAAGSILHAAPVRSDADETASSPHIEVFKTPACGCCTEWARHLEENGFETQITEVNNLAKLKRDNGVPGDIYTCHTGVVEGYTIEGHVPAADIKRLLAERPDVKGLLVPGMPQGSPGMESSTPQPYTVFTFDESGHKEVYSRH